MIFTPAMLRDKDLMQSRRSQILSCQFFSCTVARRVSWTIEMLMGSNMAILPGNTGWIENSFFGSIVLRTSQEIELGSGRLQLYQESANGTELTSRQSLKIDYLREIS